MSDRGPWGLENFNEMSWHDVHVHGLRFERFDDCYGTADLLLDIDYILNWNNASDVLQFTVCQSILTFRSVSGFKLELDYVASSAGMCPFSVAGVERELITSPTGNQTYHWYMPINWPQGSLNFDSPSFELVLVGEPLVQSQQYIERKNRDGQVD